MAHVKALVFGAALVLASCKRGEPAPGDPPAASASAPGATSHAPAAEFHEETFDLALRPVGSYSSGKPGVAEIVLTPKGEYHTNDRYPYKFKTDASSGVAYRIPVFTKDDVTLEEKRATMKVDFTPDGAGEKTVSGQFAFSLCSAERCLVEKRDLALKLSVN